MDQPLITVLVGAEGGASGQGASAQLIYKQLSKALSSVSSQKPLEISVALQKDLKQDLQAQLGKIKGLTVDVAANIKATTGVISSSSAKSQGAGNQINSGNDMSTSSIAGAIDQNKKLSSSINSVLKFRSTEKLLRFVPLLDVMAHTPTMFQKNALLHRPAAQLGNILAQVIFMTSIIRTWRLQYRPVKLKSRYGQSMSLKES